jgi:hypothetical protein
MVSTRPVFSQHKTEAIDRGIIFPTFGEQFILKIHPSLMLVKHRFMQELS